MRHRTVSGRIAYTSLKPEWAGRERGREWFSFTHHGDGSTIMRARCEIEEPAPSVLREIIYHLGPGGVYGLWRVARSDRHEGDTAAIFLGRDE